MSMFKQSDQLAYHPSSTPSKPNTQAEYVEFLKLLKVDFFKRWEQTGVIPPGTDNTLDDFIRIKTLGEGSFGRVVLVRYKTYDLYYAMKILAKSHIVKCRQVEHAFQEKRLLQSVRYPFLVNLEFFLQDKRYLYFVLPFLPGGDFFTYLHSEKKMKEDTTKFYAAQVALGLEYLNFMHCIYRDLKPENILMDKNGYLKICDFGFSKIVRGARTYTMCGTPEYIAPEIILGKGYGIAADWWSYGVLVYEMVAGYTPFYSNTPIKIYEKTVSGKYRIPHNFSKDLKDLIHNLLQIDLTKRFGNLKDGVADIKNHRWFRNIDWVNLLNRKVKAPYIPPYKSAGDTRNFDVVEEKLDIDNDNKPVLFSDSKSNCMNIVYTRIPKVVLINNIRMTELRAVEILLVLNLFKGTNVLADNNLIVTSSILVRFYTG